MLGLEQVPVPFLFIAMSFGILPELKEDTDFLLMSPCLPHHGHLGTIYLGLL